MFRMLLYAIFFFFKQKTAYEMRISDWSSDVCSSDLPAGLKQAQQLPEPIFTPSTKAAVGDHDQNVSFDAVVDAVGADLANQVRDATLPIYRWAAAYAAERGIIIADTKFEFGTDADGKLYVMDEMLTPDRADEHTSELQSLMRT